MISGASSSCSASARVATMSCVSTAISQARSRRARPRARCSRGRRVVARRRPRTSRRGSPSSSGSEVVRRLSASTLASFQVRAPRAVSASRAESRTDARDLVGGDRGAGTGPAADDALLGLAFGDVPRRALAGPGPVVALVLGQRAVRDRLVPAPAQLLDHRPRHGRVHVARDRNLHARAGYPASCYPSAGVQRTRAGGTTCGQPGEREDPTGGTTSAITASRRSRAGDHRGRRASRSSPGSLVLLPVVVGIAPPVAFPGGPVRHRCAGPDRHGDLLATVAGVRPCPRTRVGPRLMRRFDPAPRRRSVSGCSS